MKQPYGLGQDVDEFNFNMQKNDGKGTMGM